MPRAVGSQVVFSHGIRGELFIKFKSYGTIAFIIKDVTDLLSLFSSIR